jgi:ligand-binding SRPBCC domain-containing protein
VSVVAEVFSSNVFFDRWQFFQEETNDTIIITPIRNTIDNNSRVHIFQTSSITAPWVTAKEQRGANNALRFLNTSLKVQPMKISQVHLLNFCKQQDAAR